MAISLRTPGSWAVSNATTQTVTLPTHSTGDMLIVRTVRKPFTNPDDVAINTAGWAAVATGVANGATANGNGTGSMAFKAFWKIAASGAETNPVVTWGTTAAPGAAVAMAYEKGGAENWLTPVGNGGGDATARTSQTSTIASHVSVTAGDMVDFFRGQCDDSGALTVPTITQASVTFAAVSEQPAAALLDGTSNDIAADGGYRLATAGTSSAAAVVTGTSAASEQHGAWMTRLRVFTPETHDGTLAGTGGGVLTTGAQKAANSSVTATGGGVATVAGQKAASSGLTATGAGVGTTAATTDRPSPLTATGGGVATFDALAEFGEEHDGVLAATGGGVGTFAASTDRPSALTATAGGSVSTGQSTDRQALLTATGGGVASLTAEGSRSGTLTATASGTATLQADTARTYGLLLSGGGTATLGQLTDRGGAITGSGGGSATFEGSQAEDHTGSVVATGGGVWTLAGLADHPVVLAATASGSWSIASSGQHAGSLSASGGGRAIFASGSGVELPDIAYATVPVGITVSTVHVAIEEVP